jgi:hypothetical protein
MPLRNLVLAKSIKEKREDLEALQAKDAEFEQRESDLLASIDAAQTKEEREAVEAAVSDFDTEQAAHEQAKTALSDSIKALEDFIKDNPLSNDILNRQILNFVCILLRNRDMSTNEISNIVKNKSFKYSKRLKIGEKFFCILSKITFGGACFMTRILFSLYYRNN